MTTIIAEVYDAFREAGVSDEKAKAAASAVISTGHAATKDDVRVAVADLRAAIAELKSEICRALWIQGGAIIVILAGIGILLRVWPL